MGTVRNKWALAVAASALAGVGVVMAQTDATGSGQPSNPTASQNDSMQMGQQTTLTGHLTTVCGFVTGKAGTWGARGSASDMNGGNMNGNGSTATNATPTPGSMNTDNSSGAAMNGNSSSGTYGTTTTNGTPTPGSMSTANDTTADGSEKSGKWARGGMANEPLCLIDTNGQCVILGQSWDLRHQNQANANGSSTYGTENSSSATSDNNTTAGTTNTSGTANNSSSISGTGRTVTRLNQARGWLNQQVSITGKMFTKGGIRYLEVESLSPEAAAAMPTGTRLGAANP